MKKQFLILSVGFLCAYSAKAQNDVDAMRYSQLTFGGTARFASMAGSMGALGGDISTLSFNPAGIAIFKKNEFTITPTIFSSSTSSTYNGSNTADRSINFNINNIGLVTSMKLGEKNHTGWESVNFGLGYNRTNSFQNRVSVEGYNNSSSILDTYVANANGHQSADFDPFSTDLAYQTYLINPTDTTNHLYNHVLPNYGELQRKTTTTTGRMGETDLSFGGNYQNKVFIGATIGFVGARYSEESVYEEIDQKDSIKGFKSLTYSQNITSTGSGVNFKIGIIVKPIDWLRIGVALHTPTSITMKDTYNNTMSADLDSVKHDQASPQGSFDYTIITPYRAIGSVGFVISKNALLNVDYEYLDYTYAQLHSSPNVFADVNKTILTKYTAAGNLRIGGEIRFDPLSFRAGYALYGSPFKSGENMNAHRSSYTAGIGFRENNYFIDFAYVLTKYTEYSYLYDPTAAPLNSVKNNFTTSGFMLTLGVKF